VVRLKRPLLILALSFLLPFLLQAKESIRTEEGVVRHVADGDTVTAVTNEGMKLKIRLYGIDAPEIQHINRRTGILARPGQPYGEEARRALEGKVLRKRVKVQIMDIDRYHRMVAVLHLGDKDINREMVDLKKVEG
jgi:micrococcal nuclease